MMRAAWQTWLIGAVVAGASTMITAPAAMAQFFPLSGSLDEMDQEAQRHIDTARAAAEQAQAAAERKAANDARWGQITSFVDRSIRQTQNNANRGDTRRLIGELGSNKRHFRMGEIYYHLGAFSSADRELKRSMQLENTDWPCNQGWTHILLVRASLADKFDGREWERLRRFEDEIRRSVTNLDRAAEEPNQRNRQARERNIGDYKSELEQLPALIQQRDALLERVKQDTFNAQAFVDLINHFRDRLRFSHQARAWLEALKEFCPDAEHVVNGWADSILSVICTMQGFYEEADALTNSGPARARQQLEALKQKVAAIDEKIRRAHERGDQVRLTPDEQMLAKLGPDHFDKIAKDIDRNFERVKQALNNHRQAVERDAGRRQQDG